MLLDCQEAPGAERSEAGAEERSDDHASELARELKLGRKWKFTTVICHHIWLYHDSRSISRKIL